MNPERLLNYTELLLKGVIHAKEEIKTGLETKKGLMHKLKETPFESEKVINDIIVLTESEKGIIDRIIRWVDSKEKKISLEILRTALQLKIIDNISISNIINISKNEEKNIIELANSLSLQLYFMKKIQRKGLGKSFMQRYYLNRYLHNLQKEENILEDFLLISKKIKEERFSLKIGLERLAPRISSSIAILAALKPNLVEASNPFPFWIYNPKNFKKTQELVEEGTKSDHLITSIILISLVVIVAIYVLIVSIGMIKEVNSKEFKEKIKKLEELTKRIDKE